MKKIFVVLIFLYPLCTWSFTPKATDGAARRGKMNSSAQTSLTNVQAIIPGSAQSVKGQIFRELIGGDAPLLNWPAFPRNWLEQSSSKIIETNTSAGPDFGLSGASANFKVSIDYRYALKTSMVLIGTNRRDGNTVEDNTVSPAQREDILVTENGRAYPNVQDGYPMVGFCSFEATVMIANSTKTGIEFPIASHSRVDQEVETVSLTFFSNFFQIDGDSPMTDYQDFCKQEFTNNVQTYVLRDFSRLVTEKFAFFHPRNECQPDESQDDEKGDVSCMDWHKDFGLAVRNLTQPRCELQRNGIHKCVIKAKRGTQCPMWYQKNKNSYPQAATHNMYAYQCDKKAGLSCQWEKEPTLFLGAVIWPGQARCQ